MKPKQTIIQGSGNPSFIADALNHLLTYWTPGKVIDYIKIKSIIGNPPYHIKTKPK